jgi:sterol desaturase/sphingolipid hydroxylase (fatty acid hydroxylase superfamily)
MTPALDHLTRLLQHVFIDAGSTFSLISLTSALIISATWLVLRRKRKTPLRIKVLARALFPSRIWTHASTRADIGLFILSITAMSVLIGWGLVSARSIERAVESGLNGALGPSAIGAPAWAACGVLTLTGFLGYDFSYWLDHYLKHRVSWLWPFHRVHHTAEVLTPLTSYRTHPVDNLIFANISAVVIGVAEGLVHYLLGAHVPELAIAGTNIGLVAFLYTTIHLQHSHIRIAFTGWLGHVVFSPAHHHIHHSADPRHYDCNMGSCLAVWDWMFGTLRMPDPKARLVFGTVAEEDPHSATGTLLYPFVLAVRAVWPKPAREAVPPYAKASGGLRPSPSLREREM